MKRIAIKDDYWFNIEKARKYEEGTFFDGRNSISRATGNQWNHQALYFTDKGNWVLNGWSQTDGTVETWALIDAEAATCWLIRNGLEVPELLAPILDDLER